MRVQIVFGPMPNCAEYTVPFDVTVVYIPMWLITNYEVDAPEEKDADSKEVDESNVVQTTFHRGSLCRK